MRVLKSVYFEERQLAFINRLPGKNFQSRVLSVLDKAMEQEGQLVEAADDGMFKILVPGSRHLYAWHGKGTGMYIEAVNFQLDLPTNAKEAPKKAFVDKVVKVCEASNYRVQIIDDTQEGGHFDIWICKNSAGRTINELLLEAMAML